MKFLGRPFFFILNSLSIISFIWFKNQGSIFESLFISFKFIFFLIASPTSKILFGIFSLSFFLICFVFKLNIWSNPETVSTDYDTSDRLYFEPLIDEYVFNIIKREKSKGNVKGVITQFGGQTPIKLEKFLHENNLPILGTQYT